MTGLGKRRYSLLFAIDRHPVRTTWIALLALAACLELAQIVTGDPLLLARLSPDSRQHFYGQVVQASIGLLGVSMTVLAILVALPDRPQIHAIRSGGAWPLLKGLLLSVASISSLTLVLALVTLALSAEWAVQVLSQLVLASCVVATLSMVVSGVAFWLLLKKIDEPVQPERGTGPA
jgi:hypothetical protein